MAKFVSVFISETHRKLITGMIWSVAFLVALGVLAGVAANKAHSAMQLESRLAAEHFVRLRTNLVATIDAMHAELTAAPCTPAFNEQLRKVAYRPDGLNEFLYAPGGLAQCSVNRPLFDTPTQLGDADIPRHGERFLSFWVDHDLGFMGLDGEKGTIALSEPFAAVVPAQDVELSTPEWMSVEVVLVAEDGRWWHRSGVEGVYSRHVSSMSSGTWPVLSGQLRQIQCDPRGLHCIAAEVNLLGLASAERVTLAVFVLIAGVVAAFLTSQANVLITRYWSFEARFRRHLGLDSIICAYQPVMEVETGEISGCEVLARWRDIDDRVVFPDRFIGLVERHGMTLRFTELVAQRACAELSAMLPPGKRIQVNFNIFPRDLDSQRLLRIFSGFTAQPDRFDVVLEIIESDAIPPSAQREIEALRRAGIKTYIDDFGTGYSNMQNLAALSVDGVKLDRAFAMAPDNSMMAQMLRHAVEMIHSTGRVMVVEGVETAERLQLLRSMQARVDFVQGYFISRPLDIAAFAAFLTPRPISLADRKREAGLEIVAA